MILIVGHSLNDQTHFKLSVICNSKMSLENSYKTREPTTSRHIEESN